VYAYFKNDQSVNALWPRGLEPVMEKMIDLHVPRSLIDFRPRVFAEGRDGVTGAQKLG
jgi:hypothetical protein